MKATIFFRMTIICCFGLMLITSSACKKENENSSPFSFKFNGTLYKFGLPDVGPYGGSPSVLEWEVWGGKIWIFRPDLFGGIISFGEPACTYLAPAIYTAILDSCNGTSSVIDTSGIYSTASIYLYKSGSKNQWYENCVTKYNQYDFATGLYYDQRTCDLTGTFELELVNSQNKIVRITEGRYRMLVIR